MLDTQPAVIEDVDRAAVDAVSPASSSDSMARPSPRLGSRDERPRVNAQRASGGLVTATTHVLPWGLSSCQGEHAHGRFDIILCRNVLIYFDQATKTRVLESMASQMPPDGMLYLGGAETVLGITGRFAPLPGERGVYGLSGTPAERRVEVRTGTG